jgi:exosortase A
MNLDTSLNPNQPAKRALSPQWQAVFVVFALALGFSIFAFRKDWSNLVDLWLGTENFSHGLLIGPIALWLIWRDKEALLRLQPSPSLWGLVLVLGAVGVWLLGKLSGVQVASSLGIVAMIPSLVLLIAGWRVAWAISFALAFLFFMLPFGEAAQPLLMEWTAVATIEALRFTGIPVFQEGMNFVLPTGRWSVIEACSGLRYLLAASVLAVLFAYLNFKTLKNRLLFFALSILMALIANWMRAYLVVMVGHLSHMKYGTGDDHVYYGWVFFGIVMAGLFWMGLRWKEPDRQIANPMASSTQASLPSAASKSMGWLALAGLLAIAPIALASHLLGTLQNVSPRPELVAKMSASPSALRLERLALEPDFKNALAVYRAQIPTAESAGANSGVYQALLFSAYYARQSMTNEMIAHDHGAVLSSSKDRVVLDEKTISVAEAGKSSMKVRQILVRSGSGSYLMYFWMRVSDRATVSNYQGKLLTAWSMLTGKGDHSVANGVMVPVTVEKLTAPDPAIVTLIFDLDRASAQVTAPR